MLDRSIEKQLVKLTELINSRFYGKYVGIVKTIGSEENLSYIKVSVPEIYGDLESPWAKPCVPFGGMKFGFFMLPNTEDLVWVEFEAGDISRPIWTGFLWARNELPELAGGLKRIIHTPSGNTLLFDDQNEELKLICKDITITLTQESVEINAGSTITMNSSSVDIESGSKITINSSGVDVT